MIRILAFIPVITSGLLSDRLSQLVVVSRVHRGYLPVNPGLMPKQIASMVDQIPQITPASRTAIAARIQFTFKSLQLYREVCRVIADLWYSLLTKRTPPGRELLMSVTQTFHDTSTAGIRKLMTLYPRDPPESAALMLENKAAALGYLGKLLRVVSQFSRHPPTLANLNQLIPFLRNSDFIKLVDYLHDVDTSAIKDALSTLPLKEEISAALAYLQPAAASAELPAWVFAARWVTEGKLFSMFANHRKGIVPKTFRQVAFRYLLNQQVGDVYHLFSIEICPPLLSSTSRQLNDARKSVEDSERSAEEIGKRVVTIRSLLRESVQGAVAASENPNRDIAAETCARITQIIEVFHESTMNRKAHRDACSEYLQLAARAL